MIFLLFTATAAKAQKVDSIYVHLYTDSLKKGTYNYINIDGLLSNGIYQPLDSNDIMFSASDGEFHGNSLWIDNNFNKEKVTIKVVLKTNPVLYREFTLFIKKKLDDEHLKTSEEILNEIRNKPKRKDN